MINTNGVAKHFKELLDTSDPILVTSHISPDPDAISSLLLMGETLKVNFPDKHIEMILEEDPRDLEFISGYSDIKFESLIDNLNGVRPHLVILLDGNNFDRFSRHAGEDARQYVNNHGTKVAILDHHEPTDQDKSDVFINDGYPATAQQVYMTCFKELGLKKPKNAAPTAMFGLYSDTGGFAYFKEGTHKETLEFIGELVSGGANIEEVKNQLTQFNKADIEVMAELSSNFSSDDSYSYTFLSDEFIGGWEQKGRDQADLKRGIGIFLDEFIRNVDQKKWGFLVYKNSLEGDGAYSVSFRSQSGYKDVSALANQLGGGGHKPAAGARFKAQNIQEAIERVKSVAQEVES